MSLDIIGTTLRSDAPTQNMRLAALEALTALRDELEQVKVESDGHVKEIARLIKVHEPRYHELLSIRQQLADQSARVQALEADKRRLEPRFDSLVLRCNRCKRLFYACMIRALRDADTFRDIASMLTAGATVELLEDKQELKRSEFGCKCEPAEYAALSQEQATTRNV